jgi:hypothetical protein
MIGSSVNPALGRIDYSPITQGAQSAAQSIQAGGQAYGQMFANLGQQIGSGIQNYQQNKQKRDFLETQARSNIGEAIQSMNNFRANPSAYGGKAPIRPEALEGFSLEDIPKISIGKLEGFVSQTEKLLQKPRAIESFIQQQALTDAANQQRNARLSDVYQKYTKPAPPSMIARPGLETKPIDQVAFTSDLLRAGASPDEVATLTKAMPFAQQQQLDTALHRNVIATVDAEIKSGITKPELFQKRYATLMANNGRNVIERFPSAGTYVRRDNQGGAVQAVRSTNTGQIGVVDVTGKFNPIDSEDYMPMTTSDANIFLDGPAFKKLGQDLVDQENAVKEINRFVEGVGSLPKGIDKLVNAASAKIKTIFDAGPLTEQERAGGLSQARQQGLLGALRTTILGPGVLTEIDAQRILDRIGGDVTSVSTNPALLRDIVAEVIEGKMNQYQENLNIYNSHVAGRYGSWGIKQRNRIAPFTEYNLKTVPLGMDLDIWNAMTPEERKAFQKTN